MTASTMILAIVNTIELDWHQLTCNAAATAERGGCTHPLAQEHARRARSVLRASSKPHPSIPARRRRPHLRERRVVSEQSQRYGLPQLQANARHTDGLSATGKLSYAEKSCFSDDPCSTDNSSSTYDLISTGKPRSADDSSYTDYPSATAGRSSPYNLSDKKDTAFSLFRRGIHL